MDDIFYNFSIAPKIKGSQYSSAITDYSNLFDDNTSTGIVLQASETFYLKFDTWCSAIFPSRNMKFGIQGTLSAQLNFGHFVLANKSS